MAHIKYVGEAYGKRYIDQLTNSISIHCTMQRGHFYLTHATRPDRTRLVAADRIYAIAQ